MNKVEIIKTVVLPIIQYMISPIIAGYFVWWLTNRKSLKDEKNKMIRQGNIIINALEVIVKNLKLIDEKLNYYQELSKGIHEMENGYFDKYKEEFQISDELVCLEQYKSAKEYTLKEINDLRNQIKKDFFRLKELPTDLLPTDIHKQINKLVISDVLKIDTSEYQTLINKLEILNK